MYFTITSNAAKTEWNISPLSGSLEGAIVATVEGMNLEHVKFVGKTMVANIRALWGATILMEEVYGDMETLRALHLGGVFDTQGFEKLTVDYDGYLDMSRRVCKGAKRLLAMGSAIHAKGLR